MNGGGIRYPKSPGEGRSGANDASCCNRCSSIEFLGMAAVFSRKLSGTKSRDERDGWCGGVTGWESGGELSSDEVADDCDNEGEVD